MKISELISELEKAKEEKGDVTVKVYIDYPAEEYKYIRRLDRSAFINLLVIEI